MELGGKGLYVYSLDNKKRKQVRRKYQISHLKWAARNPLWKE
jgi:hypothetical protein